MILGRHPPPWDPIWTNTYSGRDGRVLLSNKTAGCKSKDRSSSSRPSQSRYGEDQSHGSRSSSQRKHSIVGQETRCADISLPPPQQPVKKLPSGLHPQNAIAPPLMPQKRFLGRPAACAAPGYTGHIPGKDVENVLGLSFRPANEKAVIELDTLRRIGCPYLQQPRPSHTKIGNAEPLEAFGCTGIPQATTKILGQV